MQAFGLRLERLQSFQPRSGKIESSLNPAVDADFADAAFANIEPGDEELFSEVLDEEQQRNGKVRTSGVVRARMVRSAKSRKGSQICIEFPNWTNNRERRGRQCTRGACG